jgi:hypothetical protein
VEGFAGERYPDALLPVPTPFVVEPIGGTA